MKRAIELTRRSSHEQEGNTSDDTQKLIIRAYAERHNIEIVDSIPMIETGAGFFEDRKRPEFKALLNRVINDPTIDCLIVQRLDRFARKALDAYYCDDLLFKAGKSLICAEQGIDTSDRSLNARMLFHSFAQLAEMEKLMFVERTTQGKERCREKNIYTGGKLPYGKKIEATDEHKRVVDNPQELGVIKRISMMSTQGLQPKQIANRLNQLNILNRRDELWTSKQIERIKHKISA